MVAGIGTDNRDRQAGWVCAYTPLEILLAAGLEPVRLFGSPGETEDADAALNPNICPYVRACLQQGLDGRAPAAMVFAGCCDGIRRLYDAWSYCCQADFTFLMDVPRASLGGSAAMYNNSVGRLASALEGYTGREITARGLRKAIGARREVDGILTGFSEAMVRGYDPPGEESLRIYTDAQELPLADFISRYSSRGWGDGVAGGRSNGKPVVITGNLLASGALLEMIGDCGGSVAALDLCSAGRFPALTPDTGEAEPYPADRNGLLSYLARAYMSRTPCPRMLESTERHAHVLKLVIDSGARGVIYVPLMFCDSFLYDLPRLKDKVDAAGIPGLVLVSDYRDDNEGQMRTRVEAFMEML